MLSSSKSRLAKVNTTLMACASLDATSHADPDGRARRRPGRSSTRTELPPGSWGAACVNHCRKPAAWQLRPGHMCSTAIDIKHGMSSVPVPGVHSPSRHARKGLCKSMTAGALLGSWLRPTPHMGIRHIWGLAKADAATQPTCTCVPAGPAARPQ